MNEAPDFSQPQSFNVDLTAPEIADETGSRAMPVPPVLYTAPPPVLVEGDPDLYPAPRHGVLGPKMRRRRF